MTPRRRSADGWRAHLRRRLRKERENLSFWVLLAAVAGVGVAGSLGLIPHAGTQQEGKGSAAEVQPLAALAPTAMGPNAAGPAPITNHVRSTPPTVAAAGGAPSEAIHAGPVAPSPDPPGDPRADAGGDRASEGDPGAVGGAADGAVARALPHVGAKPVAAASARNAAVDDILIPGAYRPSTDSTGRLELRIVSTYRGPADWHPPSTAEVAPPDREHATFWPTQDRASADGRTLTYAARLGYGWPASETTGPRLAVACTVAPPRRPAGTLVAVAWEPLPWPRTPARPSSAASWTVPVPEGLTQPCIATLHARLGAYPWRWQGGVTWIVEASP